MTGKLDILYVLVDGQQNRRSQKLGIYWVNGKVKRLGIEEGKKMQGFPKNFEFPVSEIQAMKQLGNSVAVPAIQAVAFNILKYLRNEPLEGCNLFTCAEQKMPAKV